MWIALIVIIGICILLLLMRKMNNFSLIARNITYIHEILHNEYKERFPDEDTLLMTCGMINTLRYNFPIEDMKLAVIRAKDGKCFTENMVNDINASNMRQFLLRKSNLFLNFVMELEAIIFANDTSCSRQDILTSVISSKDKIERTIDGTKRSYERERVPSMRRRSVSNFMNSVGWEGFRDQMGIIRPVVRELNSTMFAKKTVNGCTPMAMKTLKLPISETQHSATIKQSLKGEGVPKKSVLRGVVKSFLVATLIILTIPLVCIAAGLILNLANSVHIPFAIFLALIPVCLWAQWVRGIARNHKNAIYLWGKKASPSDDEHHPSSLPGENLMSDSVCPKC